jgi:predicted metal-dependent HD superfamily phosphohydrolase
MLYLSNFQVTRTLDQSILEALQANFVALGQQYQLETAIIEQQQQWLFKQHQEPHRHYHNLSHLYNLLSLVEQFKEHIQQPQFLELVVWYHDSVYDPASKENEAQSAEWAVETWQSYIDTSKLQQLEAYILATTKHFPQTADEDERLFLDFDLSILAAEPTIYQAYSKAIEQEYTTVYPLELYRQGRQQVLKAFLERPNIYYSTLFAQQYEATARTNLAQELQLLQ